MTDGCQPSIGRCVVGRSRIPCWPNWHFACLAEFRSELLDFWKKEVIIGIIRKVLASAQEPLQVLAETRRLVLDSGSHRFDAAMRSWASIDPGVQAAVSDADEIRAGFISEMLSDAGSSEEDTRDRLNLARIAWRGSHDLPDPDYRMELIGMVVPTSPIGSPPGSAREKGEG